LTDAGRVLSSIVNTCEVIQSRAVDDMLTTLARKLDLLLRLKLEVELSARVMGKNAAEINVKGALIVDEIREVINSNIAPFESDVVARSNSKHGKIKAPPSFDRRPDPPERKKSSAPSKRLDVLLALYPVFVSTFPALKQKSPS
jgi:hypothetical protein